jgi:hypothetical protein
MPELLSAQFHISPRRAEAPPSQDQRDTSAAKVGHCSGHRDRTEHRFATDNCGIYGHLMGHCGAGAGWLGESVERELRSFSRRNQPLELAFAAITQPAPIKPNNAEDLVTQIGAGEKSSRDFRACRSIRAKCECEERASSPDGRRKGKLSGLSLRLDA